MKPREHKIDRQERAAPRAEALELLDFRHRQLDRFVFGGDRFAAFPMRGVGMEHQFPNRRGTLPQGARGPVERLAFDMARHLGAILQTDIIVSELVVVLERLDRNEQ